MTKLLSIGADYKTKKGNKQGYMTGIMYLSPGSLSGRNLCPFASKGCLETCLYTAGRGVFESVKNARMVRTLQYNESRQEFFIQLTSEINKLINKAKRKNMIPVVRLNGTSDIPFELMPVLGKPNIMSHFPDIQFYDYTKNPHRFKRQLPKNYDLTFSRSETNEVEIEKIIDNGGRVAIVFSNSDIPMFYYTGSSSVEVIDGDTTDLRFLDPKAVIVGLKAKGKARKDTSGFVVKV